MDSYSDIKLVSIHYLSEKFNNFNHAGIVKIIAESRRAVTLHITPLVWIGIYGKHLDVYPIRFGAIENFEEVKLLFENIPLQWSGIAYLGPAKEAQIQKEGAYHVRFLSESGDYEFGFKCGKIGIGEPFPFEPDLTLASY